MLVYTLSVFMEYDILEMNVQLLTRGEFLSFSFLRVSVKFLLLKF